MNFKIITDSACDLSAEMIAQLELGIACLSVELDGKAYAEGEMTPKELYDHLRNGKLPKTSAVNPDGWAAAIRPALKAGRDVLVLAFSSGLSTTYQSAVIAAEAMREEFPEAKICTIDSKAASLGQGLYVYLCAQQKLAGKTFDEVVAYAEEIKLNICHWFTVDDLNHLKRGGRVSATTALVGTMLQIKPVLHVDNEGHLINVSKVRGRKASIEALAKKLGETGLPGRNDVAFISHGDCIEDAEYLASILKEKYHVPEVHINHVGPVIGSHSGPGTLALFFLGEHR
mgnify:CR=1 FL=1